MLAIRSDSRGNRRLLVVAATILAFTALALASAVSASSPRSGALHVTKECSEYTGLADSFCTITSSSLSAIKVGSRVVYLQASGSAALDSDVVLVVGPGNFALGHCTVDNTTGSGHCTYSGGIGQFTGFRASVDVTYLGGPNFAWNGTYSFRPHGDNENGNN